MSKRLLRSVVAGSLLAVGKELLLGGGVEGLSRSVTGVVSDLNQQDGGGDLPVPGTSAEALLAAVAGGAMGGAGYVVFSLLAPGRGAVRGAAYGATFWATTELLFRTLANRDRDWLADPKRQLPALAVFGSTVGWLADR